ncbi:Cytochrome P450, E-class, group I [Heracleum sosnowskyi]|uniref:Cytochrome P450, E-class, group I n=1 Tax=Heracleum sosnowskyi TaxID=360622 RepID=A0AAD8I7B9_9APIA|nr:Cytochrome P450, E-class, group I [Heracleum sosnowskyi]
MEWEDYVFWSALITLISLVWHLRRKNNYRRSKLPPGPRGWPVFGYIFNLGNFPHRSLEALRREYGPVVWLNLGFVNTMVLLSAGAAEEFFKNHDLSFVDRFTYDSTRPHDYYTVSIAFGSSSTYWRTLRRICTSEIFANKRINDTMLIRRKCVDELLSWIEDEVEKSAGGRIVVRDFVFPAFFNMIGNLTLSRNLVDPQSKISSEFCTALAGFHECVGRPNISDLFPWLRKLDLQGIRKAADHSLGKAIEIISAFVKERVIERQQKQKLSPEQKDFLDVLLDYRGTGKAEPAKLSEFQVTIFLMEMFFAGTETSSATIEWAMCELLQNPDQMKKIKAELAIVVGAHKKLQETDIDNLPYLHAIVEETLRIHPPAPLLIPRKAIRDTKFMDYSIPKNTQVMVNYWAIGRDEASWENALSFKPERFLDSNINYKGQSYEFLPFGSGRRMCPGYPLAHRMVHLVLGSLLHHFEWELCDDGKIIDMRETMGVTAKKLELLQAIPKRKAA